MGDRGLLEIKAENVNLLPAGNYNTGCGIPKDMLDKMTIPGSEV